MPGCCPGASRLASERPRPGLDLLDDLHHAGAAHGARASNGAAAVREGDLPWVQRFAVGSTAQAETFALAAPLIGGKGMVAFVGALLLGATRWTRDGWGLGCDLCRFLPSPPLIGSLLATPVEAIAIGLGGLRSGPGKKRVLGTCPPALTARVAETVTGSAAKAIGSLGEKERVFDPTAAGTGKGNSFGSKRGDGDGKLDGKVMIVCRVDGLKRIYIEELFVNVEGKGDLPAFPLGSGHGPVITRGQATGAVELPGVDNETVFNRLSSHTGNRGAFGSVSGANRFSGRSYWSIYGPNCHQYTQETPDPGHEAGVEKLPICSAIPTRTVLHMKPQPFTTCRNHRVSCIQDVHG